MKKKFLKEIRVLLEQQREQILHEASENLNQDMQTESDNLPDPADVAANESDNSTAIRLRERERKLLAKIEETLGKIDEGNYGFCEECGEEITEGRLRARPVASLCIDCKTKQEELERRETL